MAYSYKIHNEKYRKTKLGLSAIILKHQRLSSKRRNHPPPKYDIYQFRNWLFNQELFHVLFEQWEKSGYKYELTPSVDRINNYLSYTFENIQLMTWIENRNKSHEDEKNGILFTGHKKVAQYTLSGKKINEFISISDAGRKTGCDFRHISAVCLGKEKTHLGFIWRFVNK